MRTIRTIAELRAELTPARRAGRTIGLVPTMGALHEGHLSLMRRAREQCDVVVVSLFVNPTQFNQQSDLVSYPRDEVCDEALAADIGVDYLFAPSARDVYPDGFATTVSIAGVTDRLEGTQRGRGHFDGVATVVAKLFNIVAPTGAYFGQKDAQQVAVIKRLARDLDMPVEIVVCPTVREPDGLALSSRNVRLSSHERHRATALYRALRAAERAISAGERDPGAVIAAARTELHDVELEYFELVDLDTFAPAGAALDGSDVLAIVAARVGATRLIDNYRIQVPSTSAEVSPRAPEAEAGSPETQEALACSAPC
jgi:pantoate--beta-alanine ligase